MARIVVGMMLLLAGALAVDAFALDEPQAPVPNRQEEQFFLRKCSACHASQRVTHRRASRSEWREIVDRMRRMPQSGISPEDAKRVLRYLTARQETNVEPRDGLLLGGHKAFGRKRWLTILEIATVRKGRVTLGKKTYAVYPSGRTAILERKTKKFDLSFRADGKPGQSVIIDRWKVGSVSYEVHIVLYEVRGKTTRLARAIRRRP